MTGEASEEPIAKGMTLDFHKPLRIYGKDECGRIFQDALSALFADKYAKGEGNSRVSKNEELVEPIPEGGFERQVLTDVPHIFEKVALSTGSHHLRLNNPRAEPVLRFVSPASNRPARWLYSGDASISQYAKLLHQPVCIRHSPEESDEKVLTAGRSLIQHLLEPDHSTDIVLKAFTDVFGDDCLARIRAALGEERTSVAKLHSENFPIIYVPGADGEDLQLTPVAPMITWRLLKGELIQRSGKGPSPHLEHVAHLSLTSKLQNVSAAIGGARPRFIAEFPAPLSGEDAVVLRILAGGRPPKVPFFRIRECLDELGELQRIIPVGLTHRQARLRETLMANLFDILSDHVEGLIDQVNARDPEFQLQLAHPEELLLSRPSSEGEALELDRGIIGSASFRNMLAQGVI